MVRHMPDRFGSPDDLVDVFKALGDRTRLAVVERLSIGPASASELARPFEMAFPSFTQHLGVLERAGIVTSHKTGRVRMYQLAPEMLWLASSWLATFRNHWERRFDQLDEVLLAPSSDSEPDQPSPPTRSEP